MEYPVFKAESALAVRGARDAHGDAGVALAALAAQGLFGIGLAAFLKLFFRERFEFEAVQFSKCGANIGMVANITSFDLLDDQRLDRFLDLLPVAKIEHRLDHALSRRFLRADPARAGIPVVAECVEIGLRSRRCGVEGAVAVEFDTRNQEMQFHIAHMDMAHPEDIRLIPLEPRKGGFLEIGHHSRLLCLRGSIITMEGDHAAGVAPFSGVAVDQRAGEVRIASQNHRQHVPPNSLAGDAFAVCSVSGDLLGQQVVHRRAPRAIAVFEEAHHHLECSATISAS